MQWDHESDRVTLINSRSGRLYRVTPELLGLLNQMSNPAVSDQLRLAGHTPEQLANLLQSLTEAGLVRQVDDDHTTHTEWTAAELAVHAQAALGGKPSVRRKDIPPARLHHPEAIDTIPLPDGPDTPSHALNDVLNSRRSIRNYADTPLTLEQLGTCLYRAARVRGRIGPEFWQTTRRPSASGGGRHSIEIYLFIRNTEGLQPGAYHYDPFDHSLEFLQRWNPEQAELQQRLICAATLVDDPPPVSLYFASYYRRVQCKYGGMSLSVVYRDTGCLIQTLYLVANDLGLAPCTTAKIEAEPSPSFLHTHRDNLIHTGNFALGHAATIETQNPEFHPNKP
jgi:SagB-type dehydrogenase family enzyme